MIFEYSTMYFPKKTPKKQLHSLAACTPTIRRVLHGDIVVYTCPVHDGDQKPGYPDIVHLV